MNGGDKYAQFYSSISGKRFVATMLFYCLLFLNLSLIVIIILFKYFSNGYYWKKRGILQVDGTMWKFLTENHSLPEIYKQLYDGFKSDYIGLFLGPKPALLVKKLDDIQAVLQTDFHSFNSRGIHTNPKDVLANNVLFIDDYPRWKLLRQKISPIFSTMKIKNMYYMMERCARDFVDFVHDNQDMKEQPFKTLLTYATASIATSIYGIDTRVQNTMDCPFVNMTISSAQPSLKGNLMFAFGNTFPGLFNLLNIQPFGNHKDFFLGITKKVLESRRGCEKKRHDFIDTCIELQKNGLMVDPMTGYELEPTDEVLAAQAFFFFIAGVDTSSNTMHFALLHLSSNPNILERLHKEIDNIFNNSNDRPSYEDLERFEYLDMVINESMRVCPPIGLIQRKCVKDTILPGQVKVEKDALVIIPVYALHTDKNYFPDPFKFDPERFSKANVSKIPKFSFLPFGDGNRICIGARLARLQVKAGLAWLLRRYTLRAQQYTPKFESSFFSLRDTKASYELIVRDR